MGVRLMPNSAVSWSRSRRSPGCRRPVRIRSRSSSAAWARAAVLISLISEILHIKLTRRRAEQQGGPMANEKRRMALVGFMQAGNATVYAGSWRHPATEHGFLTAGYYEKLARTLEDGCFDLMFFDDRLAMPGIYGGSVAEAVRTGARPVKLDLSVVLGICAAVTSRIGLGATYSTTYYTPFHVARTFATLDHLSGGRAAWNVVTSVNDSEAQNYGLKIGR